ncbi:hypothetical protein Zm00014a_037311 [Zea mays]|uniref:Uncharacterized protein n=1 Tax=Zea mays TaxID=4577 RepID=A0A3L6EJ44_MAIZE|nr:hypothetical protein Zm00014a_037311 [Zea mays]
MIRVAVQEPFQDLEASRRQHLRREHLVQVAALSVSRLLKAGHLLPRRHALQPLPLDDALGADHVHHLVKDLFVQRAAKERYAGAGDELGHDAAKRPRVDPSVVVLGAEEKLRRAVRAGRRQQPRVVLVCLRRRLGHAEAAYLVHHLTGRAVHADDHVLRDDVPVQDARPVRVLRAGKELPHDVAYLVLVERIPVCAASVHVLAQVHGPGVLRDGEAVTIGAVAVDVRAQELDDGRVAATRRQGHDLSREVGDGGLHEAIVGPPREPLHGDEVVVHAVPGLVHVAEHAFAQLLAALVPLRHGRQPGDRGQRCCRVGLTLWFLWLPLNLQRRYAAVDEIRGGSHGSARRLERIYRMKARALLVIQNLR